MRHEPPSAPHDWPEWLEPLRPPAEVRERLRASILGEAAPLLRDRRSISVWDVAAHWSDVLVPVAAAAVALFAALAVQQHEPALPGGDRPVRVEELVDAGEQEGPPAVLTDASEPTLDGILQVTLTSRGTAR